MTHGAATDGRTDRFPLGASSVAEFHARFIGLIRLSPLLPFNLLNYYFGVTRVSFLQFLPGTLLGILPGTSVNVLLAFEVEE